MKRLFVMMALVLAATALLPMSAAHAAPPIHISGTYVITTTVVDARYADGNTFLTLQTAHVFYGDVTGTATGEQHAIVHADGSMNVTGTYTCDCTVLGVHGVSLNRVQGTGSVTQGLSGTWQIIGGTFQGHGTYDNVYGGTATYEGWGQMP